MTLELNLNGQNRKKFENGKNAEILVNTVKMAFLGIPNGKTQPFFKIETWNFARLLRAEREARSEVLSRAALGGGG